VKLAPSTTTVRAEEQPKYGAAMIDCYGNGQ